jgi:hypothetical protein
MLLTSSKNLCLVAIGVVRVSVLACGETWHVGVCRPCCVGGGQPVASHTHGMSLVTYMVCAVQCLLRRVVGRPIPVGVFAADMVPATRALHNSTGGEVQASPCMQHACGSSIWWQEEQAVCGGRDRDSTDTSQWSDVAASKWSPWCGGSETAAVPAHALRTISAQQRVCALHNLDCSHAGVQPSALVHL